jgi:ribosomal protein L11 methylase PrmA
LIAFTAMPSSQRIDCLVPTAFSDELLHSEDAARDEAASFRDPSGFLFRDENGTLYRQVNRRYSSHYDALMTGGLYEELTAAGLLIEHDEAPLSRAMTADAARVIVPRELPFISYPYEWCFSALKSAALLTLDIQERAMRAGLTLKDASAYNVQFEGTKPVFIDSLSFERYSPGTPWVAYGQFCRHFLAPLVLMSKRDLRLNRLLASHLDGVPLDLACRLLPWRTRLRPAYLVHLHLHSKLTDRYSGTTEKFAGRKRHLNRQTSPGGIEAFLRHLRRLVESIRLRLPSSEWTTYYESNSYAAREFEEKRRCVRTFVERLAPSQVWDLGANTGEFSRLAAEMGIPTYGFDLDAASVEAAFRQELRTGGRLFLPLCLDLANPSAAIGWGNSERMSLIERGPVDTALALALIHHLRIGNNTPFRRIAEFLRRVCRHLIIEFVPKHDVQVSRLLQSREDVFDDYDGDEFEAAFVRFFQIAQRVELSEGGRVLYLMHARQS